MTDLPGTRRLGVDEGVEIEISEDTALRLERAALPGESMSATVTRLVNARKGPPPKPWKLDPRATLADDCILGVGRPGYGFAEACSPALAQSLREAKRLVLDDAATELAVNMALSCTPRDVVQILPVCEPLEERTWIEIPHASRLVHIRGGDETALRRVGVLVTRKPGALHLVVAFDGVDLPYPFVFPSSLVVNTAEAGKPDAALDGLWGYPEDVRLGKLAGRLRATIHPSAADYVRKHGGFAAPQGLCTLTICILAMLNTVCSVDREERPEGRRLFKGETKGFLSRSRLTVQVPRRIRRVTAWAMGEAKEAAFHKRLHSVSAHYRHLTRKPKAPGWTEVVIAGETFWRKRIDGHLRGDPDLGIVEHGVTIVRGPQPKEPENPAPEGP